MFDWFKIKIPSEFKIMGNEIVNVKYPNRNALSIIFNINIYTNLNIFIFLLY